MRLSLVLPLIALQAAASPLDRRQTNSTALTDTATPVNATTTTTLTQTTITTSTSLTTQTAHITVTDHTLVTDHVTETAYIIATLPPCVDAKAIEPFTTLSGAKALPTDNTSSTPSSGTGAPISGSSDLGDVHANSSPSSVTPAGTPVIIDADHNSPNTDAAASSAPVLYPIVPPSVDTTSKDVLVPKAEGTLTYTENGISDPEIEHIFAKVTANYTYPTVVLPYTTAVSSVSCLSNGLAVTFNTTKSYDFVKSNWSTYNGTGFMIITDDMCSSLTAQQGMHAYWLVRELRYDDAKRTVTVVAVEIAVEDAFKNVQIIWGTYTPPGSSGTPNVIINGTVGTPGTSSGGSDPSTPGSNNTAPTNGTSTRDPYANSTLSCLNPPSTYLGLPTAPCGNDFDYDLNQRIGTINMTDKAALNRFGPGFGDDALAKRWWNPLAKLREAAERIARAAADAARRAAAAVAQAAEAAARKIKEAAEAAARALSNPSFNSNIPINVKPGGLRDSPFGTANSLLLFHGDTQGKNGRAAVDLYCVDCGITGAAKLNGEIQYTLLPPSVNKAVVSLNGNVKAEVALGLFAEGEYSKEVTNNLLTVPIPGAGIKVGNLLTIGVVMSLDAKAKLDVKAEGKVLIGASVSLPDFRASFDALSSAGRQISGFEPVFEKRFDASGTIDAKLDLGLPMEIAVGINVPPISFKKQVGVRNTPGIEAGATVAVNTPDAACNNGVSYYISAYNNLDLNLFGSVDRLYGFRKDKIFSDCVKIPGLPVTQPAPDTNAPAPVTPPQETTIPPLNEGTQPAQDPKPAQDPAPAPAQDPAPAVQDPASANTPAGGEDKTAASANQDGAAPASSDSRRARRFHQIAERQNATITTSTTNSTIPAQNNSTSAPIAASGNTTALTNTTTIATASNSTSPATNGTASIEDLLGKEAPDAKVGDGYTAVTIKEISGDYVFAYDDSTGNFFFDEAKEAAEYPFGGSDDIVSAAKGEDLLYYYPDEMAALGVSRFRTGPLEEAPATSSLIILGSYASDDGNVLVPVAGMTDEVFNLIYCQLDGLTDKIFLAKDVDAGIATLMKPETAFVVTGGLVQECFPVALRSPFKAI